MGRRRHEVEAEAAMWTPEITERGICGANWEFGVTTIAGGKSNVAGYMDGPSEDAKFSNDFDVVYVGRTCSLLVVDRGNAALRQISLQQEDCEHQYSSVSTSDVVMVIGAVLAGYVSCLLQHGFGSPTSPKMNEISKSERHDSRSVDKPALVVESLQEEPSAGWPSFGRLLTDLFKFSIEAIGSMLLNLIPGRLRIGGKTDLTPLRDHLIMPEDKIEPPLVQKQKAPPPMSETLHEQTITNDTPLKPQKSSKMSKLKDPSLSSKHRSSKRQEYADFYSSTEAQLNSKSQQKERIRHRHRDKSGEVAFAAVGTEPKSEMKPMDYDAKFDHYNIRNKYGSDSTFRF